MVYEYAVYLLISDYYEARILAGLYQCGDRLPSIAKISRMFRVAPATVESALSILEHKGYLRINARKASEVIYKAEPDAVKEQAARYFVARKEDIMEFCRMGNILIEPLLQAGLSKWSDGDWEKLRKISGGFQSEVLTMPVQFYTVVMATLNNNLVINFLWEIVRYLRFPYLQDPQKSINEKYQALLDRQKEKKINLLQQHFEASVRTSIKKVISFAEKMEQELGLQNVPRIPFRWNIHRQRPQRCYSLVSRILLETACGKAAIGDFLPSLPKIAQANEVSVSTARRAVNILNSLGVTRSFQGKGTQIVMEAEYIDFSRPAVRYGLRLYLESLQLIALSISNSSVYTLCAVPTKERRALAASLSAALEQENSYCIFNVWLAFLIRRCPSSLVRECYRQLRYLLVWGYPFSLHRPDLRNSWYKAEIRNILRELESDDLKSCSFRWEQLMLEEENSARALLEKYNIVSVLSFRKHERFGFKDKETPE